eukprot:CAMPEP_0172611790 /NCGR_PEP_ID=MMETSP1068-20121228/31421_1 /TAXON_ID=35684 /ORGANISM="Pseudopedinella elastica, Strain CCMP716" /LENGTH=381 /DNA_ID=CAMNT_0013415857 /DNA_START=250 /DNA_END=1396 /DNA_ORIENTATION=+
MGGTCSSVGSESFEEEYAILGELGSGFTAKVYEACLKVELVGKAGGKKSLVPASSRFAVKAVDKRRFTKSQLRALLEEASFLSELNHESVVGLHGFYNSHPDKAYLVLDLLPGGDVFDRLHERTTYDESAARDLTRTVLGALQHLELHSIVHRDLKLAALMLRTGDSDSDVVLIDFGLAARCKGWNLREECGTPGYVAPEMLRGDGYGVEVDVWATGVILYTLLGGYAPFRAGHEGNRGDQDMYGQILKAPPHFDPQWWVGVSADAKNLIKELLNKDPGDRPNATSALEHPWFTRYDSRQPPASNPSERRRSLSDSALSIPFAASRQPAVSEPKKAKPVLSSSRKQKAGKFPGKQAAVAMAGERAGELSVGARAPPVRRAT